ncbi:MAG: sulfatase [Roseibacillus sp.]|nr:sulfatase [Roseibacillus sp.]
MAGQVEAKIENVLFLISDDLKASVLGCYGDKVCKTPNIDKLAASAMVFERAYCQGLACAPSRTSFMHSRYHGAKGRINLGQHLKANGFYSARVGKIYHMRVPGDIIAGTDGLDIPSTWSEKFNSAGQEAHTPGDYACLNLNIFTTKLEGRQSTRMPHRMFVSVSYEGDGSDQPDHKTASKTIELLKKHRNKPFFLAAGFVRPHYPMVQPKQYFDPYPWEKMVLPASVASDLEDMPKLAITRSRSELNGIAKFPDNQKRMWAAYYASVTFMDEQVGRILDELDRLGLREKTAIVFTSDHGYHLGEHTFWQKSNLHEEVTRVPLVISLPGLKPGRSKSLVELVDLFPTLSAAAGLHAPEGLHGTSLLPILKDPAARVKESALSIHSSGTSMRTASWTYTRYKDGSEELYDMKNDPGQFTNRANDAESAKTLAGQRKAFDKRLRASDLKPARLR